MAAYAALVSLMNDLDDIQNHPIHSFSFEKKQITSLRQTVDLLIDFIESYDSHGRSSEALERRIASAAHAAHDVIQYRVVDQLLARSTTLRGKSRSYFFLDLQKAIDNMEFVQRKAMQFKAESGLLKASYSAAASTSGKTTMVGFDGVRDQLMHMLTGQPSGHRRVIPLVGMGGIGKTTLAKNVYEHLYIQQHFDVRLWATISQQYSAESILTQLSTTGEELHKKLWGRRYLIVLDDMWSIDAWDMIQMLLPDNGNGSCVIVTTRLSNLADHLSSDPPFKMNFLDEDKSWELFCGEVFIQGKCPLELEKVGKKIVKRCGGLPLSIIVVGGHLRKSSRAIEHWEKVASLMNPISSSVKDDQCLKIISLSYHHLPAHLKPCFLYMGIYIEDEMIDASNLLQFWIAEGFIKPKKFLMSVEEVAENNLKDLIDRNLILVCKRSWNGKAKYCGIHDIVRELCLKVGKKEKFMHVDEGNEQARVRKRRIMRFPDHEFVGYLELPLSVRSRIGRSGMCRLGNQLPIDFGSLRLSTFSKDSKTVAAHFQLHNLRYLYFYVRQQATESKGCYIIFSSISLFWNVKTLIIENLWDTISISVPYEFWEMPQLRRSSEALESRIASAAHAAHDVIQSRVVDQLLAGSTLGRKPRSYFFLDLQKAIENMEFVWRKAMQLKAKSGLLKAEQPTYSAPAASTSGKTTMVGFDGVRDQLMHMLTGQPSSNRRVIPLVGMGGIGKTTLAKNVYDHLYIQQHFDVRLWATISQQYSDETILTQLIYEESRSTSRNVNALAEELHKKLWGRRYLIVLDDMWSIEAWDMIQMFLPDNGNGSCVIVTTRLSNLANHLSSPPFDMNFLDEYNSWELFCGEAFGQGKCPVELEKVGKKIVKRCGGLPLSIIVVGGHLRKSSMAIEYWEKFSCLMNPISSSVKDEQCLKIIGLSYRHLPAHLKPCFLYLGIYTEDEWIKASELINFWVGEGFLKPKKALLSLEDVEDDYLNDLIDRNLILVRKRRWNRKAKYCGIHDIVRELCLKVGKKEKFMHVDEEGSGKAIVRKRRITRFPKRKHLKLPLAVRSRIGRSERCWLGDEIMSLDFRSLRLSGFVKDCKSLAAAHFQLLNLRSLEFYINLSSGSNERG